MKPIHIFFSIVCAVLTLQRPAHGSPESEALRLIAGVQEAGNILSDVPPEGKDAFVRRVLALADSSDWPQTHLSEDKLRVFRWALRTTNDIGTIAQLTRFLSGDKTTFKALPDLAENHATWRRIYAVATAQGLYGRKESPAVANWLDGSPPTKEITSILAMSSTNMRRFDGKRLINEIDRRVPTDVDAAKWRFQRLSIRRQPKQAYALWHSIPESSEIRTVVLPHLFVLLTREPASEARDSFYEEIFRRQAPNPEIGRVYGNILATKARWLFLKESAQAGKKQIDNMLATLVAAEPSEQTRDSLRSVRNILSPVNLDPLRRYYEAQLQQLLQNHPDHAALQIAHINQNRFVADGKDIQTLLDFAQTLKNAKNIDENVASDLLMALAAAGNRNPGKRLIQESGTEWVKRLLALKSAKIDSQLIRVIPLFEDEALTVAATERALAYEKELGKHDGTFIGLNALKQAKAWDALIALEDDFFSLDSQTIHPWTSASADAFILAHIEKGNAKKALAALERGAAIGWVARPNRDMLIARLLETSPDSEGAFKKRFHHVMELQTEGTLSAPEGRVNALRQNRRLVRAYLSAAANLTFQSNSAEMKAIGFDLLASVPPTGYAGRTALAYRANALPQKELKALIGEIDQALEQHPAEAERLLRVRIKALQRMQRKNVGHAQELLAKLAKHPEHVPADQLRSVRTQVIRHYGKLNHPALLEVIPDVHMFEPRIREFMVDTISRGLGTSVKPKITGEQRVHIEDDILIPALLTNELPLGAISYLSNSEMDPVRRRRTLEQFETAQKESLDTTLARRVAQYNARNEPEVSSRISALVWQAYPDDYEFAQAHANILFLAKEYEQLAEVVTKPENPSADWMNKMMWQRLCTHLVLGDEKKLTEEFGALIATQNLTQRNASRSRMINFMVTDEQIPKAVPLVGAMVEETLASPTPVNVRWGMTASGVYDRVQDGEKAMDTLLVGLLGQSQSAGTLSHLVRRYQELAKKYPDAKRPDLAMWKERVNTRNLLNRDRKKAFEKLEKINGGDLAVSTTIPRGGSRPTRPTQPERVSPKLRDTIQELKKLAAAKKWKELEKQVLPEIRKVPDNLDLVRLRGQAYEGRNQWEAALEWYEQANLAITKGAKRDELVKDIYRSLVKVDGEAEAKKYLKLLRRSVTNDEIKMWIDETAK